MPGLIINGKEEQIPNVIVLNYKDDPRLKLKPGEDMRSRHTRWIRSIVLHNTKNAPTTVKLGSGPSTDLDHRIARLWSTDARNAGAHLSVDWDSTVGCHCDLLLDASYHAGSMNEVSIGIEIYEDSKGVVYEDQLITVVNLVKWLCQRFGIQMQMHPWHDNSEIPRIKTGGSDCVGVFGHCHNNHKDKAYDPGFDVMKFLAAAGFREFDFVGCDVTGAYWDVGYWIPIQAKLGLKCDGVPGPKTRDALQALGFAGGLYDFKTVI